MGTKTASKTFYHLLINAIGSNVTNMTIWFALVFFVYLETHSVIATSIVSGIFMAAVALSGFWFGSLVDHYKKKRLMIISGFISLIIYVVALVIYLLVPAETWKNPASFILWIFIPLLLTGVLSGNIRGIALPTIITLLFPEGERDKANGLNGTASGIAFLICSAVSGFLVGLAGMYLVLDSWNRGHADFDHSFIHHKHPRKRDRTFGWETSPAGHSRHHGDRCRCAWFTGPHFLHHHQ